MAASVHLPITVRHEHEATAEITDVVRQIMGLPAHVHVELHEITIGTSNRLIKAEYDDPAAEGNKKRVLVRVFGLGMELLVDRDVELGVLAEHTIQGMPPILYGTFSNGYIFEFLPGRTLQPSDIHKDIEGKLQLLIAGELAAWHKSVLPGERRPMLWDKINTWLSHARKSCSFETLPGILAPFFANIDEEIALLRERLEGLASPVVANHGDLNINNMIYNEEQGTVTFIDFEYCRYCYRGFDLGNFFCEWAGLELDFSKYPSVERQRAFLKMYLEAMGEDISEESITRLAREANAFSLASHVLWAIWSVVQDTNSKIGFNYLLYATKRIEEYNRRKAEYLLGASNTTPQSKELSRCALPSKLPSTHNKTKRNCPACGRG